MRTSEGRLVLDTLELAMFRGETIIMPVEGC